jgi:hypothetical protein
MNDADSTRDQGLTTEQIATAGTAPTQPDVPAQAGGQGYGDQAYGDQAYGDQGDGVLGHRAEDGDQGYRDQGYRAEGGEPGYAEPGQRAEGGEPGYRGQGYGDQGYGDQSGEQAYGQDTSASRAGAGREPRVSLLDDSELQSITMRWKDIQAEFVDEPKAAVKEADALVAELMQRLASMFAAERAELEHRWSGGDQVSTEDLRQGLRRYRSFFERLLAA